ncbi:DUF1330 domain-containing protein [Paraburkholderia sp. J10-1]|uniref:DUF1330 domain-containing protein n=1 Tax=Paraburkholderia sp. J10-1 TaxID=2805430 RepID=UPI002AB6316F|nr:DUF1330 domain-containing protein [Paraburkholderia sp. J10-1]
MQTTRKGYWIIQCQDITDPVAMQKYSEAWAEVADKFGAVLIAGGHQVITTEGPNITRALVVEYSSYEAALSCYHSPEYENAKAFALQAMERTFSIVEGA